MKLFHINRIVHGQKYCNPDVFMTFGSGESAKHLKKRMRYIAVQSPFIKNGKRSSFRITLPKSKSRGYFSSFKINTDKE